MKNEMSLKEKEYLQKSEDIMFASQEKRKDPYINDYGGLWKETDKYYELRQKPALNGIYGQVKFQGDYNIKVHTGAGIDVPQLNMDIKSACRSFTNVHFSINFHNNIARFYLCYLYFPNTFDIVCIPHSALPSLFPRSEKYVEDYRKQDNRCWGFGICGKKDYYKIINLFTFDGDFSKLEESENKLPKRATLEDFFK